MHVRICIPRPAQAMDKKTGEPRPADEVPIDDRIPIAGSKENAINSRAVNKFSLRHTTHHPASHYGTGVLLDFKGEVFDGFMFRYLRDRLGAWIETDDPEVAASAMGLPVGEKGITEK